MADLINKMGAAGEVMRIAEMMREDDPHGVDYTIWYEISFEQDYIRVFMKHLHDNAKQVAVMHGLTEVASWRNKDRNVFLGDAMQEQRRKATKS